MNIQRPTPSSQSGFGMLEVLLIMFVVAAVGGVGLFMLSRRVHKNTHFNPSFTAQAKRETSTPQGWLTYRSTHSSVEFSYPPDWKLTQGQAPDNYIFEDIYLDGSSNFQLHFTLEVQKSYVSPLVQCVSNNFGIVTVLSNQYVMVPTLEISNKDNIKLINLMGNEYKDKSYGSSCWLSYYPTALGNNVGFVFSAGYRQPGSSEATAFTAKPAANYFDLPEVQTAKTVFTSLKQ